MREYRFGDSPEHIALTESLRNAQVNRGMEQFSLQEDDLVIREQEHQSQTSTVLMIDISHSMILYGGRPDHSCQESGDGPGRAGCDQIP